MACALLVVLDANLPKSGTLGRAEIPGVMLMAALPHRRLQHESRRQPVGMEAVYADTARAEIAGFTLIEMAIVLMIIGLIVGGVLYGRDLIGAAGARAQITQVEKFNSAANTFFGKYGYLPGDIKDPDASSFGFSARGPYAGEGDGNGVLEGNNTNTAGGNNGISIFGENGTFWVDLSTAHLIKDGLSSTSPTQWWPNGSPPSVVFPAAAIGQGNYIYTWSGGLSGGNNVNYFGLSAVSYIGYGIASTPGLTVAQASSIDRKMDDGLPQSGRITAMYLVGSPAWAAGGGGTGASPGTVAAPSSTTCYDNGGNSSNPMAYSVTQNNGNGVNCALSFRMQAGD